MDFIIDNWPWLLAIVVFFVMAIIGYYAEKTGYTEKIKFKKEKELPTFDVDAEETLKDVEEFEKTTTEEIYAEEEFNESISAEKIAEKLIEQVDREERAPDIRDLEEDEIENAEYEYIEVEDDNVDVLYEVVDPNGNFDPNANPTLRVVEDTPAPTLIEEYDEKIRANVETKKLFGEETGYLDKENAEQLLSLIKQYENDLKPNIINPETTNGILAELINLSSKVTTSKTINQESAVSVINLLDRYEEAVTPSINNPRDLAKLMNNVESYKKYIDSKTIVSADNSVFNLLEIYAQNIGASVGNKNIVEQDSANKLLGIVRQYENVFKYKMDDHSETDALLNEIMEKSDVVTTGSITEDEANNLIELLDRYEQLITPVVGEDKKELKKLNTLISDYKEYIVFKRDENAPKDVLVEETVEEVVEEPVVEEVPALETEEGIVFDLPVEEIIETPSEETIEEVPEEIIDVPAIEDIVPESTEAIEITAEAASVYNLLEEYESKIRPNLESKKLLGGTTGFIDRTYANNMFDLIAHYVNKVKPNLEDTVEGDQILSELLDFCSNITTATITQEQIDRIIELVENYEEFAKKHIIEEEKLNSILSMLSNYKDYVMQMATESEADSELDLDKISPEYTGDIINLLDQYEKYIKPFILNKKLFGEDTGFIDKKYANNMLDLLTEYEKDIKPSLVDTEETDNILNQLIEYGRTVNSKGLTKDEANNILDLLDQYDKAVNKNITDDKKLAKVNRLLEKNKGYIKSMDVFDEVEDEATNTHEAIASSSLDLLTEETKIDVILGIVKDGKETNVIEDEEDVLPVIIPKKHSEDAELVPVFIPSKKKNTFSKEMVLKATKQDKKKKKKNKKKKEQVQNVNVENVVEEVLEPVKITKKKEKTVEVVRIPKRKKKNEELVVIETPAEIPVIKSKKSKSKKVEENNVTEIIDIIKEQDNKKENVSRNKTSKKKKNNNKKKNVEQTTANVSKRNRNKKKKQNKIKKELKKIERIEKKLEEEEKIEIPIINEVVTEIPVIEKKINDKPILEEENKFFDDESYDMEYDMIEADEQVDED